MTQDTLTPAERNLVLAEALRGLDRDASQSPSFEDFCDRLGRRGWSFRVADRRTVTGFFDVGRTKGQLTATVRLLGTQEVTLVLQYSLAELWRELTQPQLALF